MVMSGRPSVIPSDRAGMMKYSSNADRCQLLKSVFVCCQRKIKKPPGEFTPTTRSQSVSLMVEIDKKHKNVLMSIVAAFLLPFFHDVTGENI